MPTKAPAPVAAPFTSNGCYAGVHAGYGWGERGFSDPGLGAGFAIAPVGTTVEVDTQGWLAGGQLGCNMQTGNFVLGVEAEYAWANIDGFALDPFFANKNGDPQTLSAETRGLGSVTGRVGYAFDRFLVYGKGGAAWAHDRYDAGLFFFGFAGITNFTATETRFGWTVGAGVEYAFWDRWSVKVEFDLGLRRLINLPAELEQILQRDLIAPQNRGLDLRGFDRIE